MICMNSAQQWSCVPGWWAMTKKYHEYHAYRWQDNDLKFHVLLRKMKCHNLSKESSGFVFCWPCILSQILVNNQPDALFHVFIYSFLLSACFEHQVLIIRRSNCINTSFGMISLYKWLLGRLVRTGIPSSHLHRLIIPDDVLILFDLLMMSNWCSKHAERWNE